MKILLVGNICAGKSSLAKSLPYDHISIDALRSLHSDGTFSGEYLAWSHFLQWCENELDIVLEFSGAGLHSHAVRSALLGKKTIVVYVDTPMETCLKRAAKTSFHTPYPWKSTINDAIKSIDEELRNKIDSGFWNMTRLIRTEPELEVEAVLSIVKEAVLNG